MRFTSLIRFNLSFSFFVWFFSTDCLALPADLLKKAELSANFVELNQEKHQGEYAGNVCFDQGTTHLRAAKVVTIANEKNKLISAVALSDKQTLAHFWTQTNLDKPILHAYAKEIKYYPLRRFIELNGDAQIVQGTNSFTAPYITYDMVKQQLSSTGNNSDHSRTQIIFYPGKKP